MLKTVPEVDPRQNITDRINSSLSELHSLLNLLTSDYKELSNAISERESNAERKKWYAGRAFLPAKFLEICNIIVELIKSTDRHTHKSVFDRGVDSITTELDSLRTELVELFSVYQGRVPNYKHYCPILKINVDNYYQYLTEPDYVRRPDEPKPRREYNIRETILPDLFQYIPLYMQQVDDWIEDEPSDGDEPEMYAIERKLNYMIICHHKHVKEIFKISIKIEDELELDVYNQTVPVLPKHKELRFYKGESELLYRAVQSALKDNPIRCSADDASHLNTFMFRILGIPNFLEKVSDGTPKSGSFKVGRAYKEHVSLKYL